MENLYQGELPVLLEKLKLKVDKVTPLYSEHYPALAQLTSDNAETFKIGHSLRHLSSSVGDMQKIIENAEHGGKIDRDRMYKKMSSVLFSLLKLSKVIKVNMEVIVLGVEEMVEKERANL